MWKENICLFLLALSIDVDVAHCDRSFKYRPTQNLNGTVMCALDQPSLVIPFDQLYSLPSGSCSPIGVRCAWQCALDSNCTNFNYREDQGRCELFHYAPQNCSTVSKCNHLQVSNNINIARLFKFI